MTARPDEVVAWLVPPDDSGGLGMLMHDSKQAAALRGYFEPKGVEFIPLVRETALQSTNARLADVLALADGLSITAVNAAESARKDHESHNFVRQAASEMQCLLAKRIAAELRRAAAGEGDDNG